MTPKAVPNLRTSDGKSLSNVSGTALCRCGASKNKPFCDGTHQTTQLEFVLDGKRFEGLENNGIVSPLFNVTFPEDNIFGVPAGITDAVSDGNWVFLKPLSKGEHDLVAKGVSLDVTTTATNTG